jgi:hypothetical protein
MNSSSEFRPVDALGLLMGFHVSIPPVGYGTRELVRSYQHLLTIVALHHLQLLLNRLEPIISIHWLHNMRKVCRLSTLEVSKPIPRRWCWHLRLSSLHVDHGLLHVLKHLCLYNHHLLKSRWRGWRRVDILVVLPIVVLSIVVVAVPYVGHLKDKR